MASGDMISGVATFDDIRRCMRVLFDGTADEEFLRFLRLQDKLRQDYFTLTQETQRIQKELDTSLKSMADLETKLFHARRLLENEVKARTEAERQRDQMERKIIAVADMLKNERNLNDETKDKLAILSTLPRKRKSIIKNLEPKCNGNDINSTGSFLSNLSLTQSEDDFLDVSTSKAWHKHRPSKTGIEGIGGKRSRLSGDNTATPRMHTRRSTQRRSNLATNIDEHLLNIGTETDRICATTKVTIPQDVNGVIRAESIIESLPVETPLKDHANDIQFTPMKQPTAPSMSPTPKYDGGEQFGSPAHNLRSTLMRKHNFASKTFIRTDTCMQCQKKIRFGAVGLRCRDCPVRCHNDCRYLLTVSCVPQTNTPTIKGFMGSIGDYAPSLPPMIPALIVHCVHEIETRGLNEVGLYRVSGSEREVKALKERFLRGKTTPYLSNIDIHVLCGCVKDFLRSLREPLIPTNLWSNFCNAVQNFEETDIQKDLYKAIELLPQPNRDTLAFLILHFQRIAECPVILMPIKNTARIFGPTIVGYSSADPDQHAIFTEVSTQCAVMENLLKIPMEYWTKYVALNYNKENEDTFQMQTPKNKDQNSLYATPLKSTIKKRKFYATPPCSNKK